MARLPPIAPNLLDRAIAVVAPRVAVRRMQARMALALAGGYTGARMDRASLSGWRALAGGPESDIVADLPALRARSRDLGRNNAIAAGAVGTQVSHVVGTGLSMQPTPDAAYLGLDAAAAAAWQVNAQREWKLWAESLDCDVARQVNFYGLQRLAFRSALESGDSFVLTPTVRRPNRPYQLALQLIEADRVCNPNFAADSDQIVAGIERATLGGEAVAVHIVDRHPGELRKRGSKWTRYSVSGGATGRRNVLHLFEPTRPGQVRGVPCLAPIIEPLKQLGRYTEAELAAAVTSGLFSLFVKMDPEAFATMFSADAQETIINQAKGWTGQMEAGKAINLLPGEDVTSANPGRPNDKFDPFVQAILQQIGMALEIPYEVLTMHFSSSYSAARAALLSAWRFFRARRDWLATYLCQPVYELFLEEAVASGRISAPGFFADAAVRAAWCAAQWTGDGPGSIDPVKEVQAAQERVDAGISTIAAESILYDGIDWETKHRQRVKEQAARKAGGLDQQPRPAAPATESPAHGAPAPGDAGADGSAPAPSRVDKRGVNLAEVAPAASATGSTLLAAAEERPIVINNYVQPPPPAQISVTAPIHVETAGVAAAVQSSADAVRETAREIAKSNKPRRAVYRADGELIGSVPVEKLT